MKKKMKCENGIINVQCNFGTIKKSSRSEIFFINNKKKINERKRTFK